MNRISIALFSTMLGGAAWLAPVAAFARPGARGAACSAHACGGGCGSLTAVGLGLAIGLGSSAIESLFAKKRS